MRALVLANLDADCIVGTDHLCLFDSIDLRSGRLLYWDGRSTATLHLTRAPKTPKVYRVLLSKTVKVAPLGDVLVQAGELRGEDLQRFTEAHTGTGRECDYVMEGVSEDAGVTITRSVIPASTLRKGRRLPLMLRNFTAQRVILRKVASHLHCDCCDC